MVAENPAAHADFLHHFTGEHDLASTSAGIVVALPRGRIEVMTGAALAFHTGLALPEEPARLVGFTVAVRSLADLVARLRASGVAHRATDHTVVIPPELAFGTIITFVE